MESYVPQTPTDLGHLALTFPLRLTPRLAPTRLRAGRAGAKRGGAPSEFTEIPCEK